MYILERAAVLQSDRNLLLHGRLAAAVRSSETIAVPSIIAYGRRKGVTISKEFSEQGLRELFLDLSHIAGMMGLFAIPKSHSAHLFYILRRAPG